MITKQSHPFVFSKYYLLFLIQSGYSTGQGSASIIQISIKHSTDTNLSNAESIKTTFKALGNIV